MKLLKNMLLFNLLLIMSCTGIAQKQTFDVVTYTPPKDWTEKQADGNISYSRIDGGSWAQIAIYNHRNSEGSIQTDFDKDWNELVAVGRNISAPEKTEPKQSGDWTVMSGSGVWQYNGANVATMLTVYSNQKICIALLCNSTAMPYLKVYQQLIGSLDIVATNNAEAVTTENNTSPQPNTTTTTDVNNISIVGLWCNNILETSGYMNGMPMYTAGYSRREYAFYGDGTYLFRTKIWWTTVKDILWVYESGTYTISGDQLIITPLKGKGEYWNKINSSTSQWGSLVKSSGFALEKVSYRFNIKYFSGSKSYDLNIIPLNETQRDGGLSPTEGYHYILRETGASLIDNPPGFKTGFENKSFTTARP